MSHAPRVFVPSLADDTVSLESAEAHYVLHVRRLAMGDQVRAFDGAGTLALAEICEARRANVRLSILSRETVPPPTPQLTLAVPLPKGDRARWLVEKLTELGVSRLVPLTTERSVVTPGATRLDKLRQAVVAATRQCERDHLMAVDDVLGWSEFVARGSGPARWFVAHPGGSPSLAEAAGDHGGDSLVTIGPEGGLTESEVQDVCERGAETVTLGPLLLRMETAAIAAAVLLRLRGGGESD